MNSARKSRLPVVHNSRSSSTNSATRVSRSRSSIQSRNTLSVQRSRSATPGTSTIHRRRSPMMRKDPRPLTDKRWQKEQSVRVVSFIQQYVPSVKTIKPMSISLFGQIIYYLLNTIDEDIKINQKNIAQELQILLKQFDYPATLQPSTLKWPNTDQAFPAALGIMVFFLDIIEVDQNTEPCITLNPEMEKKREIFLHGKIEEEDIYNQVVKMFSNPSRKEKQVREQTERDIKHLQHELAQQTEDVKLKEDKKTKIRNNLSSLEEANNIIRDNLTNIENKCEISDQLIINLNVNIEKQEKLNSELKAKLYESHPDFDAEIAGKSEIEVKKLLQEGQHTLSLQKERLELNMKKVNELDFQLVEKKSEIETLVYHINNVLTDLSRCDESLAVFMLPEVGFGQESFFEHIEKAQPSDFNKILNRLKSDYEKLEIEAREELRVCEEEKISLNLKYMSRLVEYNKYDVLHKKLLNKIELLETACREREAEVKELKDTKINLEEDYKLLKTAQERKKKLSEAFIKQEAEVKLVHERIKEIRCNVKKQLKKVMDLKHTRKSIQENEVFEKTKLALEKIKAVKKQIETELIGEK